MTIIAKTTLAAMKMPLTVEKDGQRYSLDIADDEQGTDLVIVREEGMGKREETKANKGKLLALLLGCLVTATSFADRTANQGWVKENFVSRTNEWKLVERRHALFILDLNAEPGGMWRSFELKASTNNFTSADETAKLCYWGCSDEADGYADAAVPQNRERGEDKMRLYWLTTRGAADRDGRSWTKIGTTLDIDGPHPKRLAVLVSPELCLDGRWLGEENEEIVWSFTRCDATGPERDTNGKMLWHPVQPVRWYRTLPRWAK